MSKYKIQFLSLICLIFCINSKAQTNGELDSIIGIAQTYHYTNPVKADSIYKFTLFKSKEIDYHKGIAQSHKGMGILEDVKGNPEISFYHYNSAFDIFLGQQDTLEAYKVKFNEAMIYRKLKMYQQADTLFKTCARVFKSQSFDIGVILCKTNYGIGLFDQTLYNEALTVFREVLTVSEKAGYKSSNIYGNPGNCFLALGVLDSAEFYLERAYNVSYSSGEPVHLSTWGNSLGNVYLKNEKYNNAVSVLKNAHKINQELNIQSSQLATTKNLSICYVRLKNFESAYKFQKEYYELKDSMNRKDFLLELSAQESHIENEKSKAKIVLLEEREMRAALEANQNKIIRRFLIIGVILILIISFLLFVQNKRRKRHNTVLQLKNDKIEVQNKEITDSINYAKQIQYALLSSTEEWNRISPRHFILFKPKDVVSGDFYWAFHSEKKNYSIWATADCTGHGVPGAFMSMLGIGFLNEIVIENETYHPDKILNKLRSKIINSLNNNDEENNRKDGMDIALCMWDRNTNLLHYAGANNSIYIIRAKSLLNTENHTVKYENETTKLIELKPDKMPVGSDSRPDSLPFSIKTEQLYEGDIIYTFSDGMPDQFGGNSGKKLKYKAFRKLLLKVSESHYSKRETFLTEYLTAWKKDYEQTDDICVVGMEI